MVAGEGSVDGFYFGFFFLSHICELIPYRDVEDVEMLRLLRLLSDMANLGRCREGRYSMKWLIFYYLIFDFSFDF